MGAYVMAVTTLFVCAAVALTFITTVNHFDPR